MLTIISACIFSSTVFFVIVGSILTVATVFWLVFTAVRKIKIDIEQFSILFDLISIFIVLVLGVNILSNFTGIAWSEYFSALDKRSETIIDIDSSGKFKPDIYYIVLDGYAGDEILSRYYGYDNSNFIDYLRGSGFIVPAKSRSNYPKTVISLASALNMNYIQELLPEIENSKFWWAMAPLIRDGQVNLLLSDAGYQMVAISTDWGITNIPSGDSYYTPKKIVLNDFESLIIHTTPLVFMKNIIGKSTFLPSNDAHRELVKFNFSTLSALAQQKGPKFVFAHIVSPHPPFVFDKDGNAINPGYMFSFKDGNDYPGTKEQYRQGYLGQVEFVNKNLIKMIDKIIENSEELPIIILQADHGPGMLTDFDSLENTCLQERFSIFSAYYLPGADTKIIPDDITPVNIFRIIFREYFHVDLPLLDNSFYYINDSEYIYQLVDVSQRVDEQCIITP
ncbi:MAG: sulfatase-like hydrolase/transferase [Anaerolineales bacterium]|nr:sulfatase-like hydrolase/transferase [Anaerolineales bacterium]